MTTTDCTEINQISMLCCSFFQISHLLVLVKAVTSAENSQLSKLSASGTSLAVQWLRLCTSTAEGAGSNPGWGTPACRAVVRPNKQTKTKNKKNLSASYETMIKKSRYLNSQ